MLVDDGSFVIYLLAGDAYQSGRDIGSRILEKCVHQLLKSDGLILTVEIVDG